MTTTSTSTNSFALLLQTDFQAAENWVVNFFATVKADVQVVEQDIINVAQFLSAHAPQIVSGVSGVLTAVAAAGVGIPPAVLVAAQGLTAAASAVNQAVAAQQAASAAGQGTGAQTVALLATAYQGLKGVQQSLSSGQATVAAPAAST